MQCTAICPENNRSKSKVVSDSPSPSVDEDGGDPRNRGKKRSSPNLIGRVLGLFAPDGSDDDDSSDRVER